MQEQLNHITRFIEEEIKLKQDLIDQQKSLIDKLHKDLNELKEKYEQQTIELAECKSNSEGNKQLINKLLGDLSKYQQDIEWYKHTYQSRSFPGIIKEWFIHKLGK